MLRKMTQLRPSPLKNGPSSAAVSHSRHTGQKRGQGAFDACPHSSNANCSKESGAYFEQLVYIGASIQSEDTLIVLLVTIWPTDPDSSYYYARQNMRYLTAQYSLTRASLPPSPQERAVVVVSSDESREKTNRSSSLRSRLSLPA